MRYRLIEKLSSEHSVRQLCQLLAVTRSGYYAWAEGSAGVRAEQNEVLGQRIEEVFVQHQGRYGSPRVTAVLRKEGRVANHKRVERLMRKQGLKGLSAKRCRVRTTDSNHDQPIAPNLLLNRPAPQKVDEVWVADITYIPTAQGWLFLAAEMDLYSRQILGWALWDTLEADVALQALARAQFKRGWPRGVIHHSDRGIQYASQRFRAQLVRGQFKASMSRRGNCYDNGAMEAFWSTLKREALVETATWSKDQVRRKVFEFIDGEYNQRRLHSSLGYQSPVDFENRKN